MGCPPFPIGILHGHVLDGLVDEVGWVEIWYLVSAVAGLWVVLDPLRVVGGVIEHDVNDSKQALLLL